MNYCIFCFSPVVMKIIAGLKMPYEKLDQVVQNLVAGANSGTTEKLFFFLGSSQENIHL